MTSTHFCSGDLLKTFWIKVNVKRNVQNVKSELSWTAVIAQNI